MTIRSDVSVDWSLSPRIITVAAPSVEITVQDIVDTCRNIEDLSPNSSRKKLIDAAGKEDLGGGVSVGITATLQNARLRFQSRTTISSSGTATAGGSSVTLIDAAAAFIVDGVDFGHTIINHKDSSLCTVITVDSDIQITATSLWGGTLNSWTIGDNYKIYLSEQCSVSGGNLVAVNALGAAIDSIALSTLTQVVRTSSSSATLQELSSIQYSSFGGGVTIDVVNGIPGTAFPIGTIEQPVDNTQDAVAIATTRGFMTLFISGDITFGAGDVIDNFNIIGESIIKTLITIDTAADVYRTEFTDMTVTGILDGSNVFHHCAIREIEYVEGHIHNCLFGYYTIVLSGSTDTLILDCWNGSQGHGNMPTIDMGGSGRNLGIRGWHGALKISNMTGSNDVIIDLDSGTIYIDSTVSSGTVRVRGVGNVVDNSTGTAVVSDYTLSVDTIVSDVWDADLTEHNTVNTAGKIMQQIKSVVGAILGLIS